MSALDSAGMLTGEMPSSSYLGGYSTVTEVVMPPRGGEGGGQGHASGLTGCDEIVEDLVRQGFVINTLVTIALQVEFQGFELETFLIGAIPDGDRCEIGLTSLGTDAGKLRALDFDLVIALRGRIIKRLQK